VGVFVSKHNFKGPVNRNRALQTVLIVLGAISLGLGIVGAFVPLLPTTPFVLLAAACFARSSPKFQHWLLTHPTFGPMIRDWKENGAISGRAKILATLSIAASVAMILYRVKNPNAKIVAFGVLAFVLVFILSRPSQGLTSKDRRDSSE
jgi:uncharacterized membrane protein YbaN (DUF454 family)